MSAPYGDLTKNTEVTQMLAAQTLTGNGTDTESSSIDLKGWGGALVIVNLGNSSDTLSGSLYMDLILQESDDNSSFTDVTDNDDIQGDFVDEDNGIFATIDAPAEDTCIKKVEYHGTSRYIRVLIDRTGNHASGTPVSVTGIAHTPKFAGATGVLPSL